MTFVGAVEGQAIRFMGGSRSQAGARAFIDNGARLLDLAGKVNGPLPGGVTEAHRPRPAAFGAARLAVFFAIFLVFLAIFISFFGWVQQAAGWGARQERGWLKTPWFSGWAGCP